MNRIGSTRLPILLYAPQAHAQGARLCLHRMMDDGAAEPVVFARAAALAFA